MAHTSRLLIAVNDVLAPSVNACAKNDELRRRGRRVFIQPCPSPIDVFPFMHQRAFWRSPVPGKTHYTTLDSNSRRGYCAPICGLCICGSDRRVGVSAFVKPIELFFARSTFSRWDKEVGRPFNSPCQHLARDDCSIDGCDAWCTQK